MSDRSLGAEGIYLSVQDLACGYGKGSRVVHGVSLKANPGAITAIVGPNGAGKSTVLKAIMGELNAVQGKIMVGANDVTKLAIYQRVSAGLGYVPQLKAVFPRLSVKENLEMGAYSLPASKRSDSLDAAFERFPIFASKAHQRAGTLSGGEQRLLGIARAWVVGPKVLLLDEPTAALSPKATSEVWEELLALKGEGVVLVIVEQRTKQTLQVADWVYVMTSGKNAIDGSPKDLQDNYDLGEIFMGGSPTTRNGSVGVGQALGMSEGSES